MISSAVVGGGIGERTWWLNAMVDLGYHHPDPAAHVREIAAGLGLGGGDGVGMLTAADVRRWRSARDGGVEVVATVGLGLPVLAAEPDQEAAGATGSPRIRPTVGTINLLAIVPEPLSDAALVNGVLTVTEAKTQALAEAGVPGTGTSSDAVCVACPTGEPGESGRYGGPRSVWGARVARAAHTAVAEGTADWVRTHRPGWS
ncbi:MAG: adenosylcobinamide amidohydrolase [Actinomycetales bacterium]|nr:adenosylcobinamide amidohydrolase [Actinomycetales bacterium]